MDHVRPEVAEDADEVRRAGEDVVYGFVGFKVPFLADAARVQAVKAGVPATPPDQVGGPAA